MPGDITRGRPGYPTFLARGEGRCAERGNRDDFTDSSNTKKGARARERARAVCTRCPFRLPCLLWALETEQDGVYGATTTQERRTYGDSLRTCAARDVAGAH